MTTSRQALGAAVVALMLGLATTVGVLRALSSSQEAETQARFQGVVDRLEYDVRRWIHRPALGLRGLAATYRSHGEFTTAQFRDWVAAWPLDLEFPGVRGFGLVTRVERAGLDKWLARKQQEDPGFEVDTSAAAEDLFIVTEIEPRASNSFALGLDLGQEQLRRDAIERAVDGGVLALTDRVLVRRSELQRAGWIMLMPVYRRGTNPQTPHERRQALVGLLYAPITAAEMLADVRRSFGEQLHFRLYDGLVEHGQVLYDSTEAAAPGPGAGPGPGAAWDQGRLYARRAFALGGQELTLELAGTPRLRASADQTLALTVGLAGTLLSLLTALSVWQFASRRRRAEVLAERMTAELSRVAKELRASEAFLDEAQRIADVGSWEVDLQTGALRLSAQTLRLFDLPAGASRSVEEFIGFFAPSSRALIEGSTQDAIRDGRPWDLELNLVTATGRSRWVRAVGRAERAGERSLSLVGTLQDITERKQAERALQESEQFMRVVTDNLPARVGYWSRDQRCEFANRAYRETFARTAEEIIGLGMRELLGEQRYDAYRPDIEAALRGERLTFEREEDSPAGSPRTMLVHYIPNFRDGEVHGFLVLALDVTELRQAREAAKQASAAKGQFLANTSHELRTPMNAILGMLALLRGTELETRQADYVGKAEGAARSLLGLLDDILDFSKIEAGKLVLDPRPFPLESLMRDLAVILSSSPRSDQVEILFDVDPAVPPMIVGDDVRLRQVLINLGGNAVKFTECGQVVIRVHVLGCAAARVRLEFAVSDTGIGIEAAQQARIFEEFTQAEASTVRKYGGSGLGLAISQRLVRLMGSRLALASEPGRGSRFSFELELPVGPSTASAGTPPGLFVRALFVDDNAVARQTLQSLARSLGWEADTAPGAEEAIAIVRDSARPYDVIFLDWRMPQLDGLQAAARMRRLPGIGQRVLLIMLSARAQAAFDALRADERGNFDGYLGKPVTASMLRDAVLQAAGRAPRTQQPAGGGRELHGVRILVVEDNSNNQQVARELLASRGAIVDVAPNGRVGVDRVLSGEHAYDLVLMDIQMPVMDGYEASRTLRRAGRAELPIVAMTANVMAVDRQACLAAGMNDHVGKPFDLEELVKTVRRHALRPPPGGTGDTARTGEAAPHAAGVAGQEVDVAAAVLRLGGDMDFYRQLFPSVRADGDAMLARLEVLLTTRERQEAARLFHTIKGLAGTLGAPALARVAGEAEHAMGQPGGDSGSDLRHLASTRHAFRSACQLIESELSGLAPA